MRPEKILDMAFEEHILDTVIPSENGGWEIGHGISMFSCPPGSPVIPVVGSRARFYGDGIGRPVRGLDIDGQEVFYRTDEEQKATEREWVERQKKKSKDEYEASRQDYDRRVAALPSAFRRRIEKFRSMGDLWRYTYEPYELFVCEEAVKFALVLKTPEAIDAWYKLDYDDQNKAIPISKDHSGNTFGAAAMLAKLYVSDPESVTGMHGALAPLVGCDKFGCH